MDNIGALTVSERPPCRFVVSSDSSSAEFDSAATFMSSSSSSEHVLSSYPPHQHQQLIIGDHPRSPAAQQIHEQQTASDQPNCTHCGSTIVDRYLLKVCDSLWHEQCLICSICQDRLSQAASCYVRDGKIFCKMDYKRIFGAKCARCLTPLNSTDVVQRTQDCVYHAACFTCLFCGQLLQPGDQFVVNDGQLVCRVDYESIMQNPFAPGKKKPRRIPILPAAAAPDCGGSTDCLHLPIAYPNPRSPAADPGFNLSSRISDHRKTPKRPRTILTSQQRKAFKASFEVSAKPCRKVRETLAKETGLSVRVVQVWFQNQRAKMKKIQRKQEQNSQKRSSSSSTEKRGDGEGKEDGSSRKGNRIGSPASTSMDSSSDELDVSSSPSMMDQLDKNSGDLQRTTSDDDNMNPIHKLYSMQDSYFNF